MPKPQRQSSSEQRVHQQLETLYEISKVMSSFETVEKTIPIVLNLAAKTFPLHISILTESRTGKVITTIWNVGNVSPEQVEKTKALAKLFYSQLISPPSLQAVSSFDKLNCIALPLVVYRRTPFGTLLLEGSAKMDEIDLAFADALTNLIAIAVDRYYTAKDVVALRESQITELEEERDLRVNFVSTLAHDLRNPLGAAKMSAALILSKAESPDFCKKLSVRIMGSIDRIDQMIETMLDARQIRSGEPLALKIEEFDFADMLRKTIEEFNIIDRDRILLTGIQYVRGYWSPDWIRRALENLISNAVKYGDLDRPITISLKQTTQTVQVSIHNEGIPIPPDELVYLFEQYRRAKAAHTSGIRGWGLGLTLIRGVVEAHGGTIKVESSSGTTFTVELPKDARQFSPT